MSETVEYGLEESEKEEIRILVRQAQAVYEFIEKVIKEEGLKRDWTRDTERFMALTAGNTRNLVRHSIALTKLTCWLKWLTILLIGLSLVHIFLILAEHVKWI